MGPHIFYLEDDKQLAEIFQVTLNFMVQPVAVVHFYNGDLAVDYVQTHGDMIDLFILDIRVQGSLNGLQVAERIRELGLKTPIVLLSAYHPSDHDVINRLQCTWYVKPMPIEALSQQLQVAQEYSRKRERLALLPTGS